MDQGSLVADKEQRSPANTPERVGSKKRVLSGKHLTTTPKSKEGKSPIKKTKGGTKPDLSNSANTLPMNSASPSTVASLAIVTKSEHSEATMKTNVTQEREIAELREALQAAQDKTHAKESEAAANMLSMFKEVSYARQEQERKNSSEKEAFLEKALEAKDNHIKDLNQTHGTHNSQLNEFMIKQLDHEKFKMQHLQQQQQQQQQPAAGSSPGHRFTSTQVHSSLEFAPHSQGGQQEHLQPYPQPQYQQPQYQHGYASNVAMPHGSNHHGQMLRPRELTWTGHDSSPPQGGGQFQQMRQPSPAGYQPGEPGPSRYQHGGQHHRPSPY